MGDVQARPTWKRGVVVQPTQKFVAKPGTALPLLAMSKPMQQIAMMRIVVVMSNGRFIKSVARFGKSSGAIYQIVLQVNC
jgi:hypothetical protein